MAMGILIVRPAPAPSVDYDLALELCVYSSSGQSMVELRLHAFRQESSIWACQESA